METFEPGITSAYNTHTFRVGEQGMKCINCPRVMTMDEWEEKSRCFCQSTNAVRAVARSAPPTRLQTNVRPQSNRQNAIPRTSPLTSTTSTSSPRSTSSSGSDSSRYTSPLSSNSTNYSNSSAWGHFPLDIRGGATALALLLGLGWCTAQFAQSSRNNTQQTVSTQNLQPQLNPQQVVQKYYQLAPSNREGAKALLSDAYKNWYKQNNTDSAAADFWDSINKVEVYQLANLSHSGNNYKIKVWLKYAKKDGGQPCESQQVEVILDRSKGQWLIDKTNNIEQKPDCGR
ncbi:hypothetical protein [Microcoleus sp.]|uniref:hypothetical protein n=1 Tax=Microcoleus sp. TaxID=44472 RepID=UPI00352547B5